MAVDPPPPAELPPLCTCGATTRSQMACGRSDRLAWVPRVVAAHAELRTRDHICDTAQLLLWIEFTINGNRDTALENHKR